MTSVLPEEESNVTRLKQKSQSHSSHSVNKSMTGLSGRDESRSFLNFSRENLSISHSDLEQGFVKPSRIRWCSRQTFLSCAALVLALGCAALELWKTRRVVANARDIESLRRDVETLKHRFLEKDLLDELKAFEEQLYGENASEEEDASSNGSGTDYDSNYDEPGSATSVGEYQTVTFGPGHLTSSTNDASVSKSTTTPIATPCTNKDLEDVLAVLRRAEAERGQAFERSVRERERLIEEEREHQKRRIIGEHRVRRGVRANNRDLIGQPRRRRDFHTRLKRIQENNSDAIQKTSQQPSQ